MNSLCLSLCDYFFVSVYIFLCLYVCIYLVTRILSGTLINANFGHSMLICLALINVAGNLALIYVHGKMKLNWVKTCKAKLNLGVKKNVCQSLIK